MPEAEKKSSAIQWIVGILAFAFFAFFLLISLVVCLPIVGLTVVGVQLDRTFKELEDLEDFDR